MTTTINNQTIFYKDIGSGDPVLLIHGNPDSADYWDDLIHILQQQNRCIAPDLPGFGRSSIANDFEFTLNNFSDWLHQFVNGIELKGAFHLIVHDIGAFFGLPFAIQHAQRIKSICVTNTGFFSDYKWHFMGRVWRTPILGELSNLLMNKRLYRKSLKKTSPKLSDAFIDKSYQLITRKMQKTVLKVYRAMSPSVFKGWEDQYLELTKHKPILVIWGDKDPYIPLEIGFAERLANGQTVYHLPDCGHWTAAEAPIRFANYWLTFSKKNS